MRAKYAIHAGIIIAASACSQDVAAPPQAKATGAPGSTWTVKGALSDPSLIGANVLMVGSDGSVSSSAVGEGGAFAVEVSGGASYAMHFTRDGEFVGVLTFNKTEAGGTTSVFGLPKREVASGNFASATGALEESDPAAEEPAAEEPAAEEPAAEEPAAEEPAAQEPAAQEPAAEEPAAQEPAAQEPAAPTTEPAPTAAAEDPVVAEPTMEPEPAPTDSIDLGDIVIEGGQAVPENNPTAQVDSDGDGTVDLADGDDDQDGVPDALDSVAMPDSPAAPLTIASVTPSAGQAGVEADDAVDIAFTAPLDSASITSTTAFVMNAEGVVVSAEPSVSADGVRVSLEPATQYEEGATYTVVVTEDVKSADGRPVAGEWTSDFVIGAEPAVGAPVAPFHVKSIEPLNGANDVSTKVKLQIKFDQALEEASVYFGDGSFTLVDQDGAPVAGELSVDHKKIRFEPSEELAPGATYVITVGTDVESSDGATLEAPLTLSFQTKASAGNGAGGKPEDKGGKPEDKGGKPEDDQDDDKGGKPEDEGGKPEDDEDDEDDDKGGKPEDKGGKPEDDQDDDDEDDDKGGKPEDKGGKPEDDDDDDDKGGKPEDKGGKPEDDEDDEDDDKGGKPEDKGGKPEDDDDDEGGKPEDKGGKPEDDEDDDKGGKPEGKGGKPDEVDDEPKSDDDDADEDDADEDDADDAGDEGGKPEDKGGKPEDKGGKPEDKGGKPAKGDDEAEPEDDEDDAEEGDEPEDDTPEPAADETDTDETDTDEADTDEADEADTDDAGDEDADDEDADEEPASPPGKPDGNGASNGAGNGKPPKK